MVQIGQLSITSAKRSVLSFALGKPFRRVLSIDNQYVSIYPLHYYCNKMQHIEGPGIVRCSNNCIDLIWQVRCWQFDHQAPVRSYCYEHDMTVCDCDLLRRPNTPGCCCACLLSKLRPRARWLELESEPRSPSCATSSRVDTRNVYTCI